MAVLTVEAPVSAGQDKRVVSQGLEGGTIRQDRPGQTRRVPAGGTKERINQDVAQAAGVL